MRENGEVGNEKGRGREEMVKKEENEMVEEKDDRGYSL